MDIDIITDDSDSLNLDYYENDFDVYEHMKSNPTLYIDNYLNQCVKRRRIGDFYNLLIAIVFYLTIRQDIIFTVYGVDVFDNMRYLGYLLYISTILRFMHFKCISTEEIHVTLTLLVVSCARWVSNLCIFCGVSMLFWNLDWIHVILYNFLALMKLFFFVKSILKLIKLWKNSTQYQDTNPEYFSDVPSKIGFKDVGYLLVLIYAYI